MYQKGVRIPIGERCVSKDATYVQICTVIPNGLYVFEVRV